jgi:adenylate cyclase class 2
MTFKAPGPDPEHRIEIEVEVDDPRRARLLLEALGYQVVFVYEKEREVFALGEATVMLDELPFGSFVEIEAEDIELVRAAAASIGLDWTDRVGLTYLRLFESLRARLDWPVAEATFDALAPFDRPSVEDVMAEIRRP